MHGNTGLAEIILHSPPNGRELTNSLGAERSKEYERQEWNLLKEGIRIYFATTITLCAHGHHNLPTKVVGRTI